jgi:hypothetical protein
MSKYTPEQKAAIIRAIAIADKLNELVDRVIERNRNKVAKAELTEAKEPGNPITDKDQKSIKD